MIEPYTEPFYDPEGDDLIGTEPSGAAWRVGETAEDVLPLVGGGQPSASPPAWGYRDDADYPTSGWVTVSDLDAAGGADIPGTLQATYQLGRLWLRLTPPPGAEVGEEAPGPTPADAADDGSGCVGEVLEDGLPGMAPARPVYPALYICPEDEREAWLKTPEGLWRADLWWEPLANYSYHPSGNVLADGETYADDVRCTLWLVSVGNVLCFYCTRGMRWAADGSLAPWACRMRHSAFGVPYGDDETLELLDEEGGPFRSYWCAPLPWQTDGTEPSEEPADAVAASPGLLGTAGMLGVVLEDGLTEAPPPAIVPQVYVCPRYHRSELCGLYALSFGLTEQMSCAELTGWSSWLEAVEHDVSDGDIGPGRRDSDPESVQDYRFDPWRVEAHGISWGYTAGWCTPEGLPDATLDGWHVLASASLPLTHGGTLHLAIGGAVTPNALLVASSFAEETLAEGEMPSTPINPGGGGGGVGDEDDGGEHEYEPYYTAPKGASVRVAVEEEVTPSATGAVADVVYHFRLSVRDVVLTTEVAYRAAVTLETSNGDTYQAFGQSCRMYYGFHAAETEGDIELRWKSSYMYADTDPKQVIWSGDVVGKARTTLSFPTLERTSREPLLQSSLLTLRPLRKFSRQTATGRLYFQAYSVSLKTSRVAPWGPYLAKRDAAAGQGVLCDPERVTGSSEQIAPPVVDVADASLSLVGSVPTAPPAITGDVAMEAVTEYSGSGGAATIRISGSASWQYDADGGLQYAHGSIDGAVQVSLPASTFSHTI